ncbi:MAG: gliding motility protein GldC [Bacteroidota bacterium]
MSTADIKKSEIKFIVSLDSDKLPVAIDWKADDTGMVAEKPCKAMMISLWDGNEQTTMSLDLWTKDMTIDEMKRFMFEILVGLSSTYMKATSDDEVTEEMKEFAERFRAIAEVK